MSHIKSPYPVMRNEYFSYQDELDDRIHELRGNVLGRIPDPEPIRIPLGWFLLIFAVDVAALFAIYAGIAKAMHR